MGLEPSQHGLKSSDNDPLYVANGAYFHKLALFPLSDFESLPSLAYNLQDEYVYAKNRHEPTIHVLQIPTFVPNGEKNAFHWLLNPNPTNRNYYLLFCPPLKVNLPFYAKPVLFPYTS